MGNVDVVITPVGHDAAGVLIPPAEVRVRSLPAVVVRGRLALVKVPVDLLGRFDGREGATLGCVIRQCDPDLFELAHAPVAHQLDGLLELPTATLLGTYLHNATAFLDRLLQKFSFLDGQRHRLLGIDILAGAQRGQIYDGVPMVGRAVDDYVDVFSLQELAIILEDVGLSAEGFLGSFGLSQIGVTDGNDLSVFGCPFSIARTSPAAPNQCHVGTVVLRLSLWFLCGG